LAAAASRYIVLLNVVLYQSGSWRLHSLNAHSVDDQNDLYFLGFYLLKPHFPP